MKRILAKLVATPRIKSCTEPEFDLTDKANSLTIDVSAELVLWTSRLLVSNQPRAHHLLLETNQSRLDCRLLLTSDQSFF